VLRLRARIKRASVMTKNQDDEIDVRDEEQDDESYGHVKEAGG
jgi:hypothetical protein